jgi:hypothetical protein
MRWPSGISTTVNIKKQILERAKARLEAQREAEARIVRSLPEDHRAIYQLALLCRAIADWSARAKRGERAEPILTPERELQIQAIRAAAARAVVVRDALAGEHRLETVLASLQKRGLVSRQVSVEWLNGSFS